MCATILLFLLFLQSIFIGYLIWQRVRWAAIVGVIGLLIKTVPVQTRLSHYTSMLRMKVAQRTGITENDRFLMSILCSDNVVVYHD